MSTETTQILQSNAIAAIRAERDARQAHLDAVAVESRRAYLVALRTAAQAILPDASDALKAVSALVAETFDLSDGCPTPTLPNATMEIIRAAIAAGVLTGGYHYQIGTLWFDSTGSMQAHTDDGCRVVASAAINAYNAANSFRAVQ